MTAASSMIYMASCLVAAFWSLHATAARAQEVYRCGSDSAVRYQALPCEDGQRIDATDLRSEAQTREAQARVQRQSRLADSMNEARMRRQNAISQPAAGAAVIGRRATLDDAKARPPTRRSSNMGIARGKKQKGHAGADLAVPLHGAKPLRPPASKPSTDRAR